MGHTPARRTGGYSRRAVLGQLGLAGAAAALFPLGGVRHAFAQFDDRSWYFLSDAEARWLAAACDVLIPEDEFPAPVRPVFGGVIVLSSFLFDAAPDGGWFMYVPLSTSTYTEGMSADFWLIGITLAEEASAGD